MSKYEKLIRKLVNRNQSFTYSDLKSLLNGLGYEENLKGKTSGSRVAFIHPLTKHVIRLHKPHPGNELKMYQKDQILDELNNSGVIK
jgi:hypothetical protein